MWERRTREPGQEPKRGAEKRGDEKKKTHEMRGDVVRACQAAFGLAASEPSETDNDLNQHQHKSKRCVYLSIRKNNQPHPLRETLPFSPLTQRSLLPHWVGAQTNYVGRRSSITNLECFGTNFPSFREKQPETWIETPPFRSFWRQIGSVRYS